MAGQQLIKGRATRVLTGLEVRKLKRLVFTATLCTILIFSAISLALPISPSWAAFRSLNGNIAFVSNRDGNHEIYVMNPDGRAQSRLTYNAYADENPAWSPDGSKIAFDRYIDDQWQVYIMNADGTEERPLTSGVCPPTWEYFAWHPAWSPDGSKITFVSERDRNDEIYVMNADGTGQTRLTHNTNYDGDPAWSPDGSRIVFVSDYDGNYEIYIMNADGTNQKRITDNTAKDWMPAWSPDGSKIAFVSDRTGDRRIYIMNADGSHQNDFSKISTHDEHPDWSPDGSKIVFQRSLQSQWEICVMNSDGSGQICLTLSANDDLDPDWQISHPQSTNTASATTVTATIPAVTVTSTVSLRANEPNLLVGYLGWIVAVSLAILTIGLLLYRRGHPGARHAGGTQAEKYLALLAKLDQMHERGEIAEASYLKLKTEYEEGLRSSTLSSA